MAQVAKTATVLAAERFRAQTGLPFTVAAVADREKADLPLIPNANIAVQNVAADLAERSSGASYPRVQIYCERITNALKEKFRTFSGTARITAEVRVSYDRLEDIESRLLLYVDAITDVLDSHRGDWGRGFFYTGGYEVSIAPLKAGGRHFLQSAKVTFDLDVSQN
jgi:hypothetical protein